MSRFPRLSRKDKYNNWTCRKPFLYIIYGCEEIMLSFKNRSLQAEVNNKGEQRTLKNLLSLSRSSSTKLKAYMLCYDLVIFKTI